MRALKSIRDIAFDACDMIGDTTHKYHGFLMKRMAKGFQEMHLFMTPTVTVRTIQVPYNNIIEMPKDFVYETKVGLYRDGKLILLNRDYRDDSNFIENHSVNDTQCREYIETSFDRLEYDTADVCTPFYNNGSSGTLYALGGGVFNKGLYTVDKTNGRINLGSNVPRNCEVVIEYKSDGLIEGLELVPSEMDKALEAYGLKDYYRRRKDYAQYRINEKEYNEQWYMLKELYEFKPISYYTEILNEVDRGTINTLI